jgi:hypothetical protein
VNLPCPGNVENRILSWLSFIDVLSVLEKACIDSSVELDELRLSLREVELSVHSECPHR